MWLHLKGILCSATKFSFSTIPFPKTKIITTYHMPDHIYARTHNNILDQVPYYILEHYIEPHMDVDNPSKLSS